MLNLLPVKLVSASRSGYPASVTVCVCVCHFILHFYCSAASFSSIWKLKGSEECTFSSVLCQRMGW